MVFDAIVLAGDSNKPFWKDSSQMIPEALIDINGKPMIAFILESLQQSEYIGRVVVVGSKDLLQKGLEPFKYTCEIVEQRDSVFGNLRLGIDVLNTNGKVLIVTCDIPLLTITAVNDFIDRCEAEEADVYYPIVSKQVNEASYPGVRRTYVKLKEGIFTGGNLFLVNPAILSSCVDFVQKAIALRKNPFKMSRILGFGIVIRYLSGNLTIAALERRVYGLLRIKGKGIISSYPELGIDVDKLSDLELVRRVL